MSRPPKIVEAPADALPGCPSCRKDLDTVWIKKQGMGFFQQKQILMCPHFQVFLGYGSVKFTS